MKRSVAMSMLSASLVINCAACWGGISPTERGARITTDRYQVDIRDGVVVSILNKLTNEEYLDPYADLNKIVPHLPGGLGSQATVLERESAAKLYKWPWWEHSAESTWPSHHSPSAASKCEVITTNDSSATISYKGLTDGAKQYPDETLALELAIDAATGDLLVTPLAKSPRKGVYSSSLTVSALGPAITAEAPIFDGLQLDRNMQPMLWVNQWGGYWDYAFIAFNGYKKGAVAVWSQDPELKYYKYLDYLINQEGLSFSFTGMNIPPFDKLKEAGSVTWRIQAFDKGWSQAVARFRDWRQNNVKIAPRPDWTKQISFVNGGVNANKAWVDMIDKYFASSNLDRTITFAAVIRAEGFDQNHANNTPYKGFKEDMKYWKQKGPKMMAYLQPMIMWAPAPKNDREKAAVTAHNKAETISVFQEGDAKPVGLVDQHHLGQPDWQRWFLDWVKEYIQDYGSDAVYHDQSYHCPVDSRGLAVAGKTSPQGMAEYFYKAQTENPNSLHGSEHLTEANTVGASLGIGSGILWGTAESMRKQRIDHPSAICNALHYPNAAIFSFPHYSQIYSRNLERIHWGMNLSEARGELAYAALQGADQAATEGLVNERWMDYVRCQTFVHKGLRAVFPEDYARSVLSYLKGAKGEDFRYVKKNWGSAFVEITGNSTNTIYGRIHGTPYARVEGGSIYGWPVYNAQGPAGLNPNRYYVLDPNLKRPAIFFSSNNLFSPSLYEGYVDEGYATDAFAYINIKPRENLLGIIGYDSVVLHAPEAPKAVYVNGALIQPRLLTNGQWKIDFQLTDKVSIVALLKETPEGFDKLAANAVGRSLGNDWAIDQFAATSGTNAVKATPTGFSCNQSQVLVPIRAPSNQGEGVLKISFSSSAPVKKVNFNGVEKPFASTVTPDKSIAGELSLPMKANDQGLISIRPEGLTRVVCEWIPKAQTTVK